MLSFIISRLLNLYCLVIIVYVIMSWIPTRQGVVADIRNVLGKVCDPYLNLFKRLIPPIGGIVGITPIIALFVLQLIRVLLAWLL